MATIHLVTTLRCDNDTLSGLMREKRQQQKDKQNFLENFFYTIPCVIFTAKTKHTHDMIITAQR